MEHVEVTFFTYKTLKKEILVLEAINKRTETLDFYFHCFNLDVFLILKTIKPGSVASVIPK